MICEIRDLEQIIMSCFSQSYWNLRMASVVGQSYLGWESEKKITFTLSLGTFNIAKRTVYWSTTPEGRFPEFAPLSTSDWGKYWVILCKMDGEFESSKCFFTRIHRFRRHYTKIHEWCLTDKCPTRTEGWPVLDPSHCSSHFASYNLMCFDCFNFTTTVSFLWSIFWSTRFRFFRCQIGM